MDVDLVEAWRRSSATGVGGDDDVERGLSFYRAVAAGWWRRFPDRAAGCLLGRAADGDGGDGQVRFDGVAQVVVQGRPCRSCLDIRDDPSMMGDSASRGAVGAGLQVGDVTGMTAGLPLRYRSGSEPSPGPVDGRDHMALTTPRRPTRSYLIVYMFDELG